MKVARPADYYVDRVHAVGLDNIRRSAKRRGRRSWRRLIFMLRLNIAAGWLLVPVVVLVFIPLAALADAFAWVSSKCDKHGRQQRNIRTALDYYRGRAKVKPLAVEDEGVPL